MLRRIIPLAVVAVVALVAGVIVGASRSSSEERLGERWGDAWERADYSSMYDLVSPEDRRRISRAAFAAAYRDAATTATVTRLRAGEPDVDGRSVALPVTVRTRVWRTLSDRVVLPLEGEGEDLRVDWSPELAFPGLERGERLTRRTRLPSRAAILARDRTPLAEGAERSSPLAGAANLVGELGLPPPARRAELYGQGYPEGARVGTSGLERVFERQVAGTPGGVLLAGERVLARSRPRRSRAARATIDPDIQNAAVNALGGRLGGIAVLDPRDGEVLGLSGIAFSGLQPPGSVMKVITVTAALEAKVTKLRSRYPVETSTVVGGQTIANAGGEACGGNLREVFAESCNSVFAPMGVELGAKRLVDAAERFGFNKPLGIPGAAVNTIPSAERIGGDNAVGSSAIGQGQVLATALGMASMAATIANAGVRVQPSLARGERARRARVTTRRIAAIVRRLMIGVVEFGTGKEAAIRGTSVAGKTGTAELGGDLPEDAWFVAFAPARRPRLAIGVLVVQAGFGGDVAAPMAKQVLQAALGR